MCNGSTCTESSNGVEYGQRTFVLRYMFHPQVQRSMGLHVSTLPGVLERSYLLLLPPSSLERRHYDRKYNRPSVRRRQHTRPNENRGTTATLRSAPPSLRPQSASYQKDILRAFHGVEKFMQPYMGNTDFYFGILTVAFDWAISWTHAANKYLTKREGFPSWNWMGFEGPVQMAQDHGSEFDQTWPDSSDILGE
jgi:hypothetical protein